MTLIVFDSSDIIKLYVGVFGACLVTYALAMLIYKAIRGRL